MRSEIVVGDDWLLLGVGDADSHLARLTCHWHSSRLTSEKATDASILGTLVREADWRAEMEVEPLRDEGLKFDVYNKV